MTSYNLISQSIIISLIKFCLILTSFFHQSSSAEQATVKTFQLDQDRLSLSFVQIPAGKTIMGDRDGQKDERPQVPVTLKDFYLQDTEITRGIFKFYVEATKVELPLGCQVYRSGWQYDPKASWVNPGYHQTNEHPVVCVSWQQAKGFALWLSEYLNENFLLPSEAQWEHATRAGSSDRYYWGTAPEGLCVHANASDLQTLKRFPTFKSNQCDDGFLETAPVKSFLSNPYGLHDVYGNAWEWVEDCWVEHYHDIPPNGDPLLKGDCSRRVFRGGAWGDNPNFARSGLRNRGEKDQGKDDVGFRLVWAPKTKPAE